MDKQILCNIIWAIHLCIAFGRFCATETRLSSYSGDRRAHKALTIYYLSLHRKSFPTFVLKLA